MLSRKRHLPARIFNESFSDGELTTNEVAGVTQRIRNLRHSIALMQMHANKLAWSYFYSKQQELEPVQLQDLLWSRKRAQHLRVINDHAIENGTDMYLFKRKWLLTGYVEAFFYRYEGRGRSDNVQWNVRPEIEREESLR